MIILWKLKHVGLLSPWCQTIHIIHVPVSQSHLVLCLVTVILQSSFHWEKLNGCTMLCMELLPILRGSYWKRTTVSILFSFIWWVLYWCHKAMPQKDLHIRYWDSKTSRAKLHYLDSFLSGKSSAKDVF